MTVDGIGPATADVWVEADHFPGRAAVNRFRQGSAARKGFPRRSTLSKRFFSPDSFWNTKIEANPTLHPRSGHYVDLLPGADRQDGFHLNLHSWTMPVYAVTKDTPTVRVDRRIMHHTGEGRTFYIHSKEYIEEDHPLGHGPGFGSGVPIPEDAIPDQESDAHLALVDYERGLAWDMWGAQRRPDGTWWSCSGIKYDLYGSGVFDPKDFPAHNGESIHMYGPSHASGVPVIAGLIMYDELMTGRIEHKLAFGCKYVALLEHCFPPAIWTDGSYPNGIPQGALLQLDPEVDLEQFGLSERERVVAKALQEYGAAVTMYSDGTTLYGEGLWTRKDRSWDGVLVEEGLMKISFEHYRFIDSGTKVEKGMVPMLNPGPFKTYYDKTGLPENIELK